MGRRMSRPTLEVRRGRDRGRMKTSWLDARFSFSFGPYRNPFRMNFGSLRALNEDVIEPGTGFARHPHHDLDIFMLPLAGEIEHSDSLGHLARVRPGQVHRMRAGTGIEHSQMNASKEAIDRHLQVWFTPRRSGGDPCVETRDFELFRAGQWCAVASPDGRRGSFELDHDALMATGCVLPGVGARHTPRADASLYLHVIDGEVTYDGMALESGDALALRHWPGTPLHIDALNGTGRLLLFEFGPGAR
jgi:quercetin 2,3-dioxygenase